MYQSNNPEWHNEELAPEINFANQQLMKDCCLLIKGKAHGALIAAIYSIKPIHMITCKSFNIAK